MDEHDAVLTKDVYSSSESSSEPFFDFLENFWPFNCLVLGSFNPGFVCEFFFVGLITKKSSSSSEAALKSPSFSVSSDTESESAGST